MPFSNSLTSSDHITTSPLVWSTSYEGTLGALSSPLHSLYPADSAVLYISGADCDSCLYVPEDGTPLTMGTPYYVRVTAFNAQGASEVGSGSADVSLVAAVTPNQVTAWHNSVRCGERTTSRINRQVLQRKTRTTATVSYPDLWVCCNHGVLL